MKDDGFRFEEVDDKRTWGDGLVPDCEKVEASKQQVEPSLPVLEYLAEFKALIDACGQVSYFYNMKKFVGAGVNKAKNVAAAYHHDLRYYSDQLTEWKVKAERSFAILGHYADRFGYKMPVRKNLLNDLTLSEDRRSAYKGYLGTCLKHLRTLSPGELETKYQNRLQKRLKKTNR
jgi:hypothetical protein